MELNVYRIFDAKIKAYLPPIFERTHEGAIRMFGAAASDPNHSFGKYPEDYYLFFVGIDDDTKGEITPVPHEPLGNGLMHRDMLRQHMLNGDDQVEAANLAITEAATNGS